MNIQQTAAVKASYRDNPRYGRTTRLVVKATGEVLFEGMGDHTRRALWKTYTHLSDCKNVVHAGDEAWRR